MADIRVRLATKSDVERVASFINQRSGASCVLEDVRIGLTLVHSCRIFLAEFKRELIGLIILYKRDAGTLLLRHTIVSDVEQLANHDRKFDYISKRKILQCLIDEISKYLTLPHNFEVVECDIDYHLCDPEANGMVKTSNKYCSDESLQGLSLILDVQSAVLFRSLPLSAFRGIRLPSLQVASHDFDVWSGMVSTRDIGLPANPQRYHICHAQISRLKILIDFDKLMTRLHRPVWLQKMRDHSNSMLPGSVALWLTYQMNPNLSGFGFIRPGAEGVATLGPLYATSPNVARMLFRALIGSFRPARENGIRVAVPSDNDNMRELCKEAGLKYDSHQQIFGEMTNSTDWNNIYCLSNSVTEII